jgi:DNA-binding NtrC family response regulator
MVTICQHSWPYNVRELASAVKRAASVSERSVLDAEDLPETVTSCMKDYGKPLMEGASRASVVPAAPDAANVAKSRYERPTPAELEALLREHRGNIAAVGRVLGKDRAQIHRWIQMFGIDPDAHR